MHKGWNNALKRKIAISYFLIFVATGVAFILLYNGIQNIITLDKVNSAPNAKLHQIYKLLSLVYKAENEARTFFLSNNNTAFAKHISTLNEISLNIDTLNLLCVSSPNQLKNLNTLRELLALNRNIIKRLSNLNLKEQNDLLYSRALNEAYLQAFDLQTDSKIIKRETIIQHDSVINVTNKRNFFQKVIGIFSTNKNEIKSTVKISYENVAHFDTIHTPTPTDSIVKTIENTLGNLKNRQKDIQEQSISRESKLLHNNRQLLEQIREIVTSLESDEVKKYSDVLTQSSNVLQKTTKGAILLAIVSILVMIFFIFLIFRDISSSRKHQQALQLAKQNAEDLAKAKEQFLANMSHEIRTPLGSIIGFTSLLQKTQLEPAQKQHVIIIEKSSEHLLSLVNDILDLSKMEAGKLLLEKTAFNLADLVKEVADSLSIKTKEKGLQLLVEIPAHANKQLIGDPYRIRQVILNILSNAIKFTEKGSITISVDLRLLYEKYRAEICIIDTGIGIPLEKQKEIFEEFSQADTRITRKYGGTGLGLSIARKLTEMHGGKISLESALGSGSKFTVRLLLEKFDINTNSPSDIQHAYNKVIPNNFNDILKKCKVLVVEDDEVTELLLSMLFKNANINGIVAKTGLIALQLLENELYDVVFTDIQMPTMSGIDLLNAIRSHNRDSIRNIPVIALTANILAKKSLLEQGFTGFLSKPFRESELFDAIYVAVANKTVNAQQPTETEVDNLAQQLYSFTDIMQFSGNDMDALKLIVKAFVVNSRKTILEMKEFIEQRNLEGASARAHRLLPTFRQFKLHKVIYDLEKLERYKDIELSDNEFKTIAERVIPNTEELLQIVGSDSLLAG